MDGGQIARRLAKWSVYLLVSVATGGAWIFYFADAPTLFHDFFTGTAPPSPIPPSPCC
jgi:polyferredoxin